MSQNYSYGSAWNLIKILNIEPPGDLERIEYFLELANKRIASWSGLDIFNQLSDDMKDRIQNSMLHIFTSYQPHL